MRFINKLFTIFKLFLLKSKFRNIKLVATDIDGVLTDGGIFISNNGEKIRKFNMKDGLGIKLLQSLGIEVAFISGGDGENIIERAQDLKVNNCLICVKNKKEALTKLQKALNVKVFQTAYIGDDLNDIPVKDCTGLLISTADASPGYKKFSDFILKSAGGSGAFREFADILIDSKKGLLYLKKDGWIEKN